MSDWEISFVCIPFEEEEVLSFVVTLFTLGVLFFLVGSAAFAVLADVAISTFVVGVGIVVSSSGGVVVGGSGSRSSSLYISEWAVLLYQSSKSGSVSVACIFAEVSSSSLGSEVFLFLDSISCFSCFSRRSVLLILAGHYERYDTGC